MSVSRRSLLGGLGGGGSSSLSGALIAARGREAAAERWPEAVEASMIPPPQDGEIRISSNENPLGPGPRAVEAIDRTRDESNRYPINSEIGMKELRALVGEINGASPGDVVLGSGSSEILKNAAQAYTSPERAYVSAAPSYRDSRGVAEYNGAEIREPQVDADGRIPLDAMADAVEGAGLVYVCNPNNPTGTIHGADAIAGFVETVRQRSPETVILIDEAYHDYVTDPSYRTQVALAAGTPRVLVARTFSKAHGMAGLRVGYLIGHPDTLREMRRWHHGLSLNVPSLAAAQVSIEDPGRMERERDRNTGVREFTREWFRSRGFDATDSRTNFIFVRTGMPAGEFRSACAERNIRVGRDFPPYAETHARISIGTREEMERATQAFGEILASRIETTDASALAARRAGRQAARAA